MQKKKCIQQRWQIFIKADLNKLQQLNAIDIAH